MKTVDLDAILQKKNLALKEVSTALDKAITFTFNNSKHLTEETQKTLETSIEDLRSASKEKVDSVIERLKKLSEKLATEASAKPKAAPKSKTEAKPKTEVKVAPKAAAKPKAKAKPKTTKKPTATKKPAVK